MLTALREQRRELAHNSRARRGLDLERRVAQIEREAAHHQDWRYPMNGALRRALAWVTFQVVGLAIAGVVAPVFIASLAYLFQPTDGFDMRTLEASVEEGTRNVGGECRVSRTPEEGDIIYCRKWRSYSEMVGAMVEFFVFGLVTAMLLVGALLAVCMALRVVVWIVGMLAEHWGPPKE